MTNRKESRPQHADKMISIRIIEPRASPSGVVWAPYRFRYPPHRDWVLGTPTRARAAPLSVITCACILWKCRFEPRPAQCAKVFECCTRFQRMYIHCVSSRHWPSRCCDDRARLVADKDSPPRMRNGKVSQKKPGCLVRPIIAQDNRNREWRALPISRAGGRPKGGGCAIAFEFDLP